MKSNNQLNAVFLHEDHYPHDRQPFQQLRLNPNSSHLSSQTNQTPQKLTTSYQQQTQRDNSQGRVKLSELIRQERQQILSNSALKQSSYQEITSFRQTLDEGNDGQGDTQQFVYSPTEESQRDQICDPVISQSMQSTKPIQKGSFQQNYQDMPLKNLLQANYLENKRSQVFTNTTENLSMTGTQSQFSLFNPDHHNYSVVQRPEKISRHPSQVSDTFMLPKQKPTAQISTSESSQSSEMISKLMQENQMLKGQLQETKSLFVNTQLQSYGNSQQSTMDQRHQYGSQDNNKHTFGVPPKAQEFSKYKPLDKQIEDQFQTNTDSTTMFEYTQDYLSNKPEQQPNQYLISELEVLRDKVKLIESSHQRTLLDCEFQLADKTNYIQALEEQVNALNQQVLSVDDHQVYIKRLEKQIRSYQKVLQDAEKQKQACEKELAMSKKGLQQVLKVVNDNKSVIIDDILDHVNLFDQSSSNNVYELLTMIVSVLFKRVNCSSQQMVQTHQSVKTQSTDHSSTNNFKPQFASNQSYKEPQKIEAELSDCHKKLKDLERLIQLNKNVTPHKIGSNQTSNQNSPRYVAEKENNNYWQEPSFQEEQNRIMQELDYMHEVANPCIMEVSQRVRKSKSSAKSSLDTSQRTKSPYDRTQHPQKQSNFHHVVKSPNKSALIMAHSQQNSANKRGSKRSVSPISHQMSHSSSQLNMQNAKKLRIQYR